MNSQLHTKIVSFSLCFRDFLYLPVLFCHPRCLQSDVFSGSSEHRFAKGSAHLSLGFSISESASSQLFINCYCESSQIPFLQIPDEPLFPLSLSVGRLIVIRMGRWSDDRISSGSQSYLSRKTAWAIVTSGEEKAPVAGCGLLRVIEKCTVRIHILRLRDIRLLLWG